MVLTRIWRRQGDRVGFGMCLEQISSLVECAAEIQILIHAYEFLIDILVLPDKNERARVSAIAETQPGLIDPPDLFFDRGDGVEFEPRHERRQERTVDQQCHQDVSRRVYSLGGAGSKSGD